MTITPMTAPLTEDADGVMRIVGSRVTLATVLLAFRDGATAEEIATAYALQLPDVYSVIAYYLNHRGELDGYVDRQLASAELTRKQIESRPGYAEFRKRILDRARDAGLH